MSILMHLSPANINCTTVMFISMLELIDRYRLYAFSHGCSIYRHVKKFSFLLLIFFSCHLLSTKLNQIRLESLLEWAIKTTEKINFLFACYHYSFWDKFCFFQDFHRLLIIWNCSEIQSHLFMNNLRNSSFQFGLAKFWIRYQWAHLHSLDGIKIQVL